MMMMIIVAFRIQQEGRFVAGIRRRATQGLCKTREEVLVPLERALGGHCKAVHARTVIECSILYTFLFPPIPFE